MPAGPGAAGEEASGAGAGAAGAEEAPGPGAGAGAGASEEGAGAGAGAAGAEEAPGPGAGAGAGALEEGAGAGAGAGPVRGAASSETGQMVVYSVATPSTVLVTTVWVAGWTVVWQGPSVWHEVTVISVVCLLVTVSTSMEAESDTLAAAAATAPARTAAEVKYFMASECISWDKWISRFVMRRRRKKTTRGARGPDIYNSQTRRWQPPLLLDASAFRGGASLARWL